MRMYSHLLIIRVGLTSEEIQMVAGSGRGSVQPERRLHEFTTRNLDDLAFARIGLGGMTRRKQCDRGKPSLAQTDASMNFYPGRRLAVVAYRKYDSIQAMIQCHSGYDGQGKPQESPGCVGKRNREAEGPIKGAKGTVTSPPC